MTGLILAEVLIITFGSQGNVYAAERTAANNAATYYSIFGNKTVFVPDAPTDGKVYFCSAGKKATSGTRFKTVGYKMTVRDNEGNWLQSIYYEMDGRFMKLIDDTEEGGYDYTLYAISLYVIKSRMNATAQNALKNGNCNIVLDACMVVTKNGVPQGAMNDNGWVSGSVYDTYTGIASAADWSDGALESLHSYYSKTVNGLFHTIIVNGASGISSTKGSGTYCYGTEISISASPKPGYAFTTWNNNSKLTANPYKLYANTSATYTAYAKIQDLTVSFYRNSYDTDKVGITKKYIMGTAGQKFPSVDWKKEGFHMIGWNNKKSDTTAGYSLNCNVADAWIKSCAPAKNIYAVWQKNKYTVKFDTGQTYNVYYDGEIVIPDGRLCKGYIFGDGTGKTMYSPNKTVSVADMCKKLGLEYTDGGVINFYVVWEHEPVIEAEDMYFSVQAARDGLVTEEMLSGRIKAHDVEDGDIPYGMNGTNYFRIQNYSPYSIRNAADGEIIGLDLEVMDSFGNIVSKQIKLKFVDSKFEDQTAKYGKIRFISDEYYGKGKAGGLLYDSRWLNDPSYINLLQKALEA